MRLVPESSELRESNALLGDPQALRARMGTDGYLFLGRLLDPDSVRAVGRRGLGRLQDAGWTVGGDDPVVAPPRAPVRAVRLRDAFGDPGYRRLLADPGLNSIPFVSPLADLMTQLLGPAGFCYPLKLPRIVYPVSAVPRQPGNYTHKDYRAVQDMFTSWVPLGSIPRTVGGLAVLPGSQQWVRARNRPLDRIERGWRSSDYEPGDVLVFHCLTTHAALPNRSERMRYSAEFRWQLRDQPAPRRLVIGPHGREIGSRQFSRLEWWRPVTAGPELFDNGTDRAGPRLPAAPSRFVWFSN
ncbi:MAG: phytanoyl-CoA dioxygenase family protein [Acidimicrobiales bacterium]